MHDGMEKSQSIFNRKQFIMVCALAGLLLLGGVLGGLGAQRPAKCRKAV